MEKKKQHTVPRCYLENFADKGGLVHVLRRDGRMFGTRPENVLTDNCFYTVQFSEGGATQCVEDALSAIEGGFARVYRTRIANRVRLCAEDHAHLMLFVAAMMLRTRSQRAAYSQFFSEIRNLANWMNDLPVENKIRLARTAAPTDQSVPVEEVLTAGKDLNSYQAIRLVKALPDFARVLARMSYGFILSSGDVRFITSDNPVSVENPVLEEYPLMTPHPWSPTGLMHPETELTLPLSPDVLLLCGWKLKHQGGYIPLSAEYILELRNRTLRSAYGELIAFDPEQLRVKKAKMPTLAS